MHLRASGEKRKAEKEYNSLTDSTRFMKKSFGSDEFLHLNKPMLNVLIMDDLSGEIKAVAKEFSANVDERFVNYYFAFNGVEAVEELKKLLDTCEGDFLVVADFDMIGHARRFLKIDGPDSDAHDPWFINNPYNGGHALCMMAHAYKLKKTERSELGKLHFICHSSTPTEIIEASLNNNAVSKTLRPNFSATLKKGSDESHLVIEAMVKMDYQNYLTPENKNPGAKCLEFIEKVRLREKADLLSIRNVSLHDAIQATPTKRM